MLKKHFTILLLLVVLTAGAFAQAIPSGTGRIEAMGNSPFILDAATDIYNNPAWNNYYRNYAFGDIGRNIINDFELSDQFAGVTFGVGKQLNLGLIVNRRDDVFDRFYDDSTYRPANTVQVPIALLLGMSLNKNFHISLAPYYAAWSYSSTTSDTNTADVDASSTSLGAKLGVLYMLRKGWVEGVIDFGMNSFKNEATTGSTVSTLESDGGIDLGVGLRAWLPINNSTKLAVVPFLGFETYSWNGTLTSPAFSSTGMKHSYMNLNGGVGLNLPISDDIQIAGGLSMAYGSTKVDSGSYESKTNVFLLPGFHFGGEWRIADWLTGRGGFFRGVNRVNRTEDNGSISNEETYTDPTSAVQTVSLGAGFHFGRFSIDATVSEKWLKQGINFVSGTQTDLFGVISASYNFGK